MSAPRRSLGQMSSPEVDQSSVLVIAVGSCEQHGPHLPLGTDTFIASWLTQQICEAVPGTVEGPPITIGASGEHEGFSGTLSIGTSVLDQLLCEVIRSARSSFSAVVLVNGHGGNEQALELARARADFEGDRVLVVHAATNGGDAHAGATETSMLLALHRELVDLDRAARGNVAPLSDLADQLRAKGVKSVSANGILGDPTGATAQAGEAILEALRARSIERVARWAQEVTP